MQSDISFTATTAGLTIRADLFTIAADLLIVMTGGGNPHIGDVVTLTADQDRQTVRFPSHDGRYHKDDVLAEVVAKRIQSQLPGSCVITSGVHVDGITQDQIDGSFESAKQLAAQISEWLNSDPFTYDQPRYYGNDEQPK